MSGLMQCNTDLYDVLMSGIKSQPAPESNHEDVMFFDFDDFTNNDFAIAEEVSYIDPLLGKNKRPDIVVYVNGIALAVIELKRSLVNYEEGIKQHLSNERDFHPVLLYHHTVHYCIQRWCGVPLWNDWNAITVLV